MKPEKKTMYKQMGICLIPFVYLLSVWAQLPITIPVHYNIAMQVDRMGSKWELIGILALMCGSGMIQPYKAYQMNRRLKRDGLHPNMLSTRIAWISVWIIALLGMAVVFLTAGFYIPTYWADWA